MKCYWDKLDSPIGPIYLGAINEGLVYCDISKGSEDDLRRWCAIHLPGYTLQRGDNHIINMAKQQLSGYFAGKNKKLNVPLKFTGTPFQKQSLASSYNHTLRGNPYLRSNSSTDRLS